MTATGRRFGQAALTWCAIAARALGWRPRDFWNATPAELRACLADPAAPAAAPLTRADMVHLMEEVRDGRG